MGWRIENKTVFLDITGRQWGTYDLASSANDKFKAEWIKDRVKQHFVDYIKAQAIDEWHLTDIGFVAALITRNDKILGDTATSLEKATNTANLEFEIKYARYIK